MDTINVPKAGRSLVPSETFARLTRRLTTEHPVDADLAERIVDQETQAVLDRSIEALRAAGHIADEELWRADDGACSQCHNGCAGAPPPNPKLQGRH